MYGPYLQYQKLGQGVGFLEPVSRDMFWVYSATNDGINWTVTIAQRKYSETPLSFVTTIFPYVGDIAGTVLVDADFYYVLVFTATAYSRWYKVSRVDGSVIAHVGNLSGDLNLATEACLDGAGSIIHIQEDGVVIISLDTMTFAGTATLPYPCNRPIGLAAGADGLIWAYCATGSSAAFAAIDNFNPAFPSVTSYPIDFPSSTRGSLIFYAAQNCLIYWADANTLVKWSCDSHSIIQSTTITGGAGYLGRIAGNYFANELDLYNPSSLQKVLTANGYNPLLPGYDNIGINFGQWSDGGGVIWLQADDGSVYGAVVQPSSGIPHGANCNNYENGGALSPNNPPGCGLLLGEMV